MRYLNGILGTFAVLAVTTGPAAAGDVWHSPMRPQLELTTELSEALDVRFGISTDSDPGADSGWRGYVPTGRQGLGASAMVDWEFSAISGVRLTGGAFYGNSDWGWQESRARMDDGHDATSYGFDSSGDWTPYLGLGWDQRFGEGSRLGLQLDMGVKFEGVTNLNRDDQLDRMREEAALSTQFESFRYVPMFSAGVEYRF